MAECKQQDSLPSLVEQVYAKVPFNVELGIVCGSGLGGLATQIENTVVIPYSELNGFPQSKVAGHSNELVFGTLGGKKVVAMRGRFHFYEGWSPRDCTVGIRLMAALGVRMIIVTNAAGGLDKSYKVGDVMLIEDHISMVGMAGNNPLMGPNDDEVGPRFPSISSVYDPDFGKVFARAHADVQAELGIVATLRRGCYAGVAGPNYESRHEVEMLRICGAQAVGMSTVMEVVQAAHCGLKVLGLSLITNASLGTRADEYGLEEPNHAEVVAETKKVENFVQAAVARFVRDVDLADRPQARIAAKFARATPA